LRGPGELADFGLCKVGIFDGKLMTSLRGTEPYAAPEVITTFSKCDSYTFCRVLLLLYLIYSFPYLTLFGQIRVIEMPIDNHGQARKEGDTNMEQMLSSRTAELLEVLEERDREKATFWDTITGFNPSINYPIRKEQEYKNGNIYST
jgi:serine/threonine protein kinase